MLLDGPRSFAWDLASRLERLTVDAVATTYTYDALGRVLTRSDSAGSTSYTWNDGLGTPAIATLDGGARGSSHLVHSPDGTPLFMVDSATGVRTWLHFDEMGHTVLLTNDGGEVTDRYAYTPYGEMTHEGTSTQPFTFAGRSGALCEAPDLYRMGRRLYDARSGRFLTRDPVARAGEPDPALASPYSFAVGNPLRFVDPTGEAPKEPLLSEQNNERLQNAVTGTTQGAAVIGKALEDSIETATKLADDLSALKPASLEFSTRKVDTLGAIAAKGTLDKLNGVVETSQSAAALGKYVTLAIDARDNGPAGLVKEGAEQLGQALLEQTALAESGGAIVGVVSEGIQLHYKVEGIQDQLHGDQASAMETYDAIRAAIDEALNKKKSITSDQAATLYREAYQAFMGQCLGGTAAGSADIGVASLQALSNMLAKVVGL
ncbi:MAG: RHS repeat-associated core domain-containing protein [Deltaproteobacteria bacterium]|nr:RHS repeat-associated core domain-containing protein [Deltaproteobacteria bacterium]